MLETVQEGAVTKPNGFVFNVKQRFWVTVGNLAGNGKMRSQEREERTED
jgi:hypothetical protein